MFRVPLVFLPTGAEDIGVLLQHAMDIGIGLLRRLHREDMAEPMREAAETICAFIG